MKEDYEIDKMYNPSGMKKDDKSEYELGEQALMGQFNFNGEQSDISYKFSDRIGGIQMSLNNLFHPTP